MADNQSQWPAQYPGYGWPAADGTEAPPSRPRTSRRCPAAADCPAGPAEWLSAQPAAYPVPPGWLPSGAGQLSPPPGRRSRTPGTSPPHAVMRAASADRERVVDVLKAGFTEGRLTQDEYNDRMGRAYAPAPTAS